MDSNDLTDYSTLLPQTNIQPIIRSWLTEDMPTFDVGGLVVGSDPKTATLFMKSPGVFAGKPFVDAVFDILDCKVTWEKSAVEGTYLNPSNYENGKIVLATVKGPANLILRGGTYGSQYHFEMFGGRHLLLSLE